MKAFVCTQYGPPEVLQFQEVEKPEPKENEVLIRIYATSVNSADWRIRSMDLPPGFGLLGRLGFGFSAPRQPVLGVVLAGKIEKVGKEVTQFKAGQSVFAIDGTKMGCHAEYKVMPENGALALKPDSLTYGEAAAIPFGGTTALYYLRERAKLQKGEKILINGASGAVGTAAVQLARYYAAEVTAVCSGANVDLVEGLGADRVIDYTQEEFPKNGDAYDVILDTVGNIPFSRARGSLTANGRLLAIVAGLSDMLMIPWINLTSQRKVMAGSAPERAEDLHFLAELAAAGQFKPVIDRSYAFEEMVEARRLVDSGRKRGNVVVEVAKDD